MRLSSAVSTNALHDLALHDLKDQPEDSETIAGNRRGSTLEELREGSNLDSAAPTPRRSRRSSLEYSRGLYGGQGVSFRGGLPNAPDDAGRMINAEVRDAFWEHILDAGRYRLQVLRQYRVLQNVLGLS